MVQCSGFRVQGFRVVSPVFRVRGSGLQGWRFRVQGFRIEGSKFRVPGSWCRVQGSGFMVQGSGFRVHWPAGGDEGHAFGEVLVERRPLLHLPRFTNSPISTLGSFNSFGFWRWKFTIALVLIASNTSNTKAIVNFHRQKPNELNDPSVEICEFVNRGRWRSGRRSTRTSPNACPSSPPTGPNPS